MAESERSGAGTSTPDAAPAGKAAPSVEGALGVLDDLAARLRDVSALRALLQTLADDNRRLRADNVRMARALVDGTGAGALETVRVAQENARVFEQQVKDLLEENTDLQSRVLELEELNGSMMSMYVASFQLHGSLDVDEVVRVVEEILVNFIGARDYAVLLVDDDGTLRVMAEHGLGDRLPRQGIQTKGVLAEIIGTQTAYVHTSQRAAREGILAAVPLVMRKSCVGAILVYSLLSQKDRLLKNDMELLSLLGGHAASAFVSARIYSKADRKLKTLEAILHLLEDEGLDVSTIEDGGAGR